MLGLLSALSVALLFPYIAALIPKISETKIPIWALIPIQAIQGGVELGVLAWVGLRLGSSLGLDAPYLRALLDRTPRPTAHHFLRAAAIGLVGGATTAVLDAFVFMPMQPEAIRKAGESVARWKGLLASFYGGIGEEVLTRLFLMTLIVWIGSKLSRSPRIFVVAAFVAALVFAAGHLPAAAQLAPLDAIVVTRVLVLNTGLGFVFGLIFWRWGLEHAMLAHFAADLVLHVIAG